MDRLFVALATLCGLLSFVVVAATLDGPWFVPIGAAIAGLMLAVIGRATLVRRSRLLPDVEAVSVSGPDAVDERRHADPESVAVLVVDIDHFEALERLHGAAVVDEACDHMAALIDRLLRVGDLCHASGGGRFTVLLPAATVDDAYRVAERLRLRAIALDLSVDATVTVSVGVGVGSTVGLDDVVAVADGALATAISSGRNRTVVA